MDVTLHVQPAASTVCCFRVQQERVWEEFTRGSSAAPCQAKNALPHLNKTNTAPKTVKKDEEIMKKPLLFHSVRYVRCVCVCVELRSCVGGKATLWESLGVEI